MARQVFNVLVVLLLITMSTAKKVHYIHWNKANPLFRLDNTDHIIDINAGNLPWEYDQVNIICPVSKSGASLPERHVIYSVSREEFDSCRITNPKPRIVAVCNKPHQLLYFTISFREFSPNGQMEFRPGHDYYFISTSSPQDLHRRVGGGCATHNMKMIFKVSDNHSMSKNVYINDVQDSTTTKASVVIYNPKVPQDRNIIYTYHPWELIKPNKKYHANDVLKAQPWYTSSSAKSTHSCWAAISTILLWSLLV